MDIANINKFFREPARISAGHIGELRELVKEYPWCSSFQVMLAKALREGNDPSFEKQLKKTAVYSEDRKVLYQLIMQPALQKSIADFEEMAAPQDKSSTATEHSTEPEETDEKNNSDTLEDTGSLPNSPEVKEKTEEEQPEQEPSEALDSTNLELEVLKEVAAQAYHREFEQSLREMNETVKSVAEDANATPTKKNSVGAAQFC